MHTGGCHVRPLFGPAFPNNCTAYTIAIQVTPSLEDLVGPCDSASLGVLLSQRLAYHMPPAKKRSSVKREGLSQSDRKSNHVAAEKKRRQAIRHRFDLIASVVEGLDISKSRSEALVLGKTVEMLENLIEENKQLKALAVEHNLTIVKEE